MIKCVSEMYKDRLTLILRLLALATFVVFILMTFRTSEEASFFGRYSLRYFSYLLTVLSMAVVLLGLSVKKIRELVFQQQDFKQSHRVFALIFNTMLLLVLFAYPLVRLISQKLGGSFELSYLISLLSIFFICAVLLFLHRFNFIHSPFSSVSWRRIILFLILYHIVILTLVFGDVPGIDPIDEPFVTGNSLLNIKKFGEFPSLRPGERNADSWLDNPFLWVVSGAFQIFIGAGWLQARAFYLLVALLACPFLCFTAKQLYGGIAGWATALLTIYISIHYNWARADVWVAVATAVAVFCYFYPLKMKQKNASIPSFFCGFFIVSTIDGHFYGIAFAIMFCLLFLWEQFACFLKHGFKIKPEFTAFVLGCAVYTLFWFWFHIYLPGIHLRDIPGLFANNYSWENWASFDVIGIPRVAENAYQMLSFYFRSHPHEFLLLIFLVAATIGKRKTSDLILLFISLGSALLFFGIMAHPNRYYFVFWMPFLALWFGKFVQMLNQNMQSRAPDHSRLLSNVTVLTLVVVLAMYGGRAIEGAYGPDIIRNRHHLEEMIRAARQLNHFLPEEDNVIAGHFPFYLGMMNRLNYVGRFYTESLVPNDGDPAAFIVLLSDAKYPDAAEYINTHSFLAAACIPLQDMDSHFGYGQNREFTVALFLHPDYAPEKPSEACTPEMLVWLAG